MTYALRKTFVLVDVGQRIAEYGGFGVGVRDPRGVPKVLRLELRVCRGAHASG